MSKKLSKSSIGIRTQEFHEGLKDIVNYPLKEMYMPTTILVGKAATLATHLKGSDYIDDYQALIGLASQLGISGLELRQVLRELEEIDFVRVIETGPGIGGIRRVELKIPELRDGYEELGERWLQLHPSEIEQSSVSILDEVASFPQGENNLRSTLGLSDKDFNIILEIGTSGLLIDRYNNDGEDMLYSPLTVEEKPDILLALAQKFPEDLIVKALKNVQSYQGIPIDNLTGVNKGLATQAMRLGALCPVQIASGVPARTFLFTPRGGLKIEERVILEKARAILACVRYGEHYANVRKIQYPHLILETLRDKKRFRYSRPDFPEQYGLLVTQQIGRIEPDKWKSGYYYFYLIDTPENMRALNIAIDLLKIGLSPTTKLEVDASALLNIGGTFSGTLPTRGSMSSSV
jgi:hypothetical protein